jgi:hypothetical protein
MAVLPRIPDWREVEKLAGVLDDKLAVTVGTPRRDAGLTAFGENIVDQDQLRRPLSPGFSRSRGFTIIRTKTYAKPESHLAATAKTNWAAVRIRVKYTQILEAFDTL